MARNNKYRDDLHYLKDTKWLSGELCYWRNNPNYSKKTQLNLEKRMKEMCKKGIKYNIYTQQYEV